MQLAVGYRDDANGAPLSTGAWLNSTPTSPEPLAWRIGELRNGWLLLIELATSVPDETGLVLTTDTAAVARELRVPDSDDCADALTPPRLAVAPVLSVPGAAFTPMLLSADGAAPGASILVSIDGATETAYAGPVLLPVCGSSISITARSVKPGAIASATVRLDVDPTAEAAASPGDAPATCVAATRRSARVAAPVSSGTSAPAAAVLTQGPGGGRGADCSVVLVLQYDGGSPAAEAAPFRIVRIDADAGGGGGATVVAAAGFDTTISLGPVPGAPVYALYAAVTTSEGGWAPVAASAPVSAGLACQGIAAAPSISAVEVDGGGRGVAIAPGYAASANATTYVTMDGSDPSVAGGARLAFTGVDDWTVELQVRHRVKA